MRNDEVLNRLQNIIGYKPSQKTIIEKTGIKQSNLSTKGSRNSNWSDEEIEKLNNAFSVDIYKNISLINAEIEEDCISIPVRGNITASLGNGVEVYDELETGSYYVSRKLIKDVGANIKETDFIPCEGDSMYPTIEGGSLLMVDKSNREVFDGKIYCIRLNNQLMAKRLQFLPPNTVRVISDNQKYKPFEVDMNQELNFDFEIIGQIKWYGTVTR